MRETRLYRLYPSNLEPLTAFTSLGEHMAGCKYKEDREACPNVKYKVDLDSTRRLETRDFKEFLSILSKYPHPEGLTAHSHWDTGKSGNLGCIVQLDPAFIDVTVESSDLNILAGTHDTVRLIFNASNPPEDRNPRFRKLDLKKSIFLAHRFDNSGNATAETVARFLRRLGFDVLEGSGYEAREIPAKVEERIRSQDILLCIATAGDHHWILSETSFARALNKYVIVLCEEGVSFNRGILGADYEYMSFPQGCIEKIYTDLLYALPK